MTREQAIYKLHHCRVSNRDCVGSEEFLEALDMAIEALKAEPCDDAISRQAAKDMLKARAIFLMDTYHQPTDLEMIKLIDDLPSVTPAQKIGYWIRINNSDGNLKTYVCSECGAYRGHKQKYCEECGKKMDGEKMEGEE